MGGDGMNRGARAGKKDSVIFPGTLPCDGVLVACCVDDTDDLSGDTSTGYVAETIAREVATLGGCVVQGITRHQLLLADGVPYTSHNSAMCFLALLPACAIDALYDIAVQKISEHSASSADPGLCITVVSDLKYVPDLIEFGRAAQKRLCTKDEAYVLAQRTGACLSEHGGTGDGVIGALAGIGLRLSGEDGRFRGTWDVIDIFQKENCSFTVGEFCSVLAEKVHGPVRIIGNDEKDFPEALPIRPVRKAKPILKGGALCFEANLKDGFVEIKEPEDNLQPGQKRKREQDDARRAQDCVYFTFDNDVEECASELVRSCRNCLYRYWTDFGFTCTKE